MISTILFDLDGTLLPMDQDVFLNNYFSKLTAYLAPHDYDPKILIKSIWAGTGAMVNNDGTITNVTVFWNSLQAFFGDEVIHDKPLLESFYQTEFQNVRHDCGFTPLAAQTITWLKEKGLHLVLATNPLFPAIATHSRIRWAGLNPDDFDYITTYENSSYSKPNPDYYREILTKLHLKPEECVMVGNDVTEDMIASELGLKVFLLTDCLINKSGADISAWPNGSFPDLKDYLESTFNEKRKYYEK